MEWLEATCMADNFWAVFLDKEKEPEPLLPRLVIPAVEFKESRVRNSSRHWGVSDDLRLKQLVEGYDTNWSKVSEHFPQHSIEALQTRWLNKLDPQIKKSRWTAEEDEQVVKLYEEHGGNWKLISHRMPGRPPNAIKTRFYGVLLRKSRSKSLGERVHRQDRKSRPKSNQEGSVAGDLEKFDDEWTQQLTADLDTFNEDLSEAEKKERLDMLISKVASVEQLVRKAETQIRGLDN